MEQLRKALTRAAGPVSLIGAVGGFIGDIIAPLGNFAPWIAGLSLVFAVITLFGFLALRRRQGEKPTSALSSTVWSIQVRPLNWA